MPLLLALLLLLPAALAQGGIPVLTPGQARLPGDDIGTFKGRVVDAATGEGLGGIDLQLVRPAPRDERSWPEPWAPEGWGDDRVLTSVTTAGEGRFRFDGLAPGAYRVRVHARWLPAAGADAYIEPGSFESRRIELVAGGTLRGRVRAEGDRDVGNLPVFVSGLDPGDGRNLGQGRPSAAPVRAAPDGTFELRFVPPGVAWVQAGHPELGYSRPVPVEVVDGGLREGLELSVPDESGRFAGADSGGGVGVRLEFTELGPRIVSAVAGLPAALAGIEGGDLVTDIDGRPTRFMTSREFIQRCRGLPGSDVELGVLRGEEPERRLVLTRQLIPRLQKP